MSLKPKSYSLGEALDVAKGLNKLQECVRALHNPNAYSRTKIPTHLQEGMECIKFKEIATHLVDTHNAGYNEIPFRVLYNKLKDFSLKPWNDKSLQNYGRGRGDTYQLRNDLNQIMLMIKNSYNRG